MTKMILVSAFGFFGALASANALTVGFEKGSEYNAAYIRGTVYVQCYDHSGRQGQDTQFCGGLTLDPVEASYLVTSERVDADKVTLVATHEDGSTEAKKDLNYDSAKLRTKKRINLWIDTLTQEPLLETGKNSVAYTFTKKGAVVKTGSFAVTVKRGEDRFCETDFIYGGTCGVDYCGQYFANNNYCQ